MPKFKVSFAPKNSPQAQRAPMKATKGAQVNEFVLVEGNNDDVTVTGVDSGGNPVDISTISTTTAASDNPAVLEIGPPVRGGTYNEKAPGPAGTANVTVTTVMNDPPGATFSFTYKATVAAGPAGGVTITHGTPTPN